MKQLIVLFTLLPFSNFCQNSRNQATILGGIEFKDPKTMAWNVQTHFNRQFSGAERWSSEYGIGFYVLEHRRNFNVPISHDSSLVYPTYGATIYPGYWQSDHIYYSKATAFRLQAGINYTFFRKERFTLSAGLNLVDDIMVDYKEHGQRSLQPVAGYGDTLQYKEYHYSVHQRMSSINNAISVQVQPHIDCFFPINKQLLFTTRLGYYGQFLPEFKFIRPQLNLGISYRC